MVLTIPVMSVMHWALIMYGEALSPQADSTVSKSLMHVWTPEMMFGSTEVSPLMRVATSFATL